MGNMILYLWDKKETMERQVYKSELMIKEIESKRILDKKTETTISLRGLEKILPLSKATLSRVMNGGMIQVTTHHSKIFDKFFGIEVQLLSGFYVDI